MADVSRVVLGFDAKTLFVEELFSISGVVQTEMMKTRRIPSF